MTYIPDRGDIVWLDFDAQPGREQSGRRPALVLSPALYNGKAGLALFCPLTTRVKGYPFEVPVPEGAGVSGVILSDQVRSLDWQKGRAEFRCKVPDEVVQAVRQRVSRLV